MLQAMLLVIAVSVKECTNFDYSKSPILSFYSKKELSLSAIVNITSPEELC